MLLCTLHIDRLLGDVYMIYLQPEELLRRIIKKSRLLLVHGYYSLASNDISTKNLKLTNIIIHRLCPDHYFFTILDIYLFATAQPLFYYALPEKQQMQNK